MKRLYLMAPWRRFNTTAVHTLRTALILLTCLPAIGAAQSFYGELGPQGILIPGGQEVGILTTLARPTSLLLRGGYDFTRNFAVEIDLGIGVSDSRIDVELTDEDENPVGELIASVFIGADVPIERSAGVFGVFSLPLQYATLYGHAGVVSLDVEVAILGVSASDTDEGAAGGLGVVFGLGPVDLRLDATSIRGEEDTFSAYSLTVGRRYLPDSNRSIDAAT